jgi:hypothetical protein
MLTRFVWLLILAIAAYAQETRTSVSGRITDPQGSAVPGATVVITKIDTNTSRRMTSNETGYYLADLLLPGDYTLSVEAQGFKKFVQSGIVLQTGGSSEISVRLELGSVNESVNVEGVTPLLETAGVSSARVLANRELAALPAMVDNAMALLGQTPGIQAIGVNQYAAYNSVPVASQFVINGGVGGNLYSLDGSPIPGPSRYPAFMPHLDTIEEMRVETSNYDASVGHTTGANVVMISKTGTNQLHGTLTDQFWNQRWNGTPFFVNQLYYNQLNQLKAANNQAGVAALEAQGKQTSGHSNNYAASVGGPVWLPKIFNGKDKLFFFFSYNGTRTNQSESANNLNNTVPPPAEMQGNFSDLLKVNTALYQIYDPLSVAPDPSRAGHYIRQPLAGNLIPGARMINPLYATYSKFFPAPNNNLSDPTNNNYIAVGEQWTSAYDAYSNRIDYHANDKNRFFLSWGWYLYQEHRSDWTFQTVPGLVGTGTTLHEQPETVDWVYTVTPHTVVNVSLGVLNKRDGPITPVPLTYTPSQVGLPAYLNAKAGPYTMLPQMNVAGYKSVGPATYPKYTHYHAWSGKANVDHLHGKHELKAGVTVWEYFLSGGNLGTTSGSFQFTNAYTKRNDDNFTPAGTVGLSWADFLMGLPDTMSVPTNDTFAASSPYYGAFVQDNWRVASRLTLNFGMRFELEGGPRERYNRALGAFVPTLALPISQAAQAAYARNPIAELSPSNFVIQGGSIYVGGGAPSNIIQNQVSWLPRVGASYQIDSKTVVRGGYGLFVDPFDLFAALSNGPDQTGFSRTTTTTVTNDFGAHWLAGNPGAGVSPLVDPFPVRADGTRFDTPVGTALGSLAKAGGAWGYSDYNMQRARQQSWRVSVQRQIGVSMLVEAAYAGSSSNHIPIVMNQDALPAQFWSTGNTRNNANATNLASNVTNPLNIANFASLQQSAPVVYQNLATKALFTSPTITKAQLLMPYPQMTGLNNATASVGKARTDALLISFQRRFAKGLSLNAGYTRMDDRDATTFLNPFDPAPTWLESANGRPHRLTSSAIWQLPFGSGHSLARSGIASALFGGFQLAVTYEWQPGPLIQFPNLFYNGDLSNITNGTRTLSAWFNTAGFVTNATATPDAFHVRSFPLQISGLRSDSTNQWNANVQRQFRLRERMRLELRLEALNLCNHPQFATPVTNPTASNFGAVVSTTAAINRFFQIQGRIRF